MEQFVPLTLQIPIFYNISTHCVSLLIAFIRKLSKDKANLLQELNACSLCFTGQILYKLETTLKIVEAHIMYKFHYSDITTRSVDIDYLEVQSYEMNVYLVFLSIGDNAGLVYDNTDKPMRFYSAGHIREAFAHCQVKKAVMKHDTPYDEMIGNPPKASQSMALPFTMTLPY